MILITGGLGFIGSHFIKHILNERPQDLEIINVDCQSYGANPLNLKIVENDAKYSFIRADINDISRLKINNPELIVNFAAESHVDRSISDPRPFFWSNIQGTFELLEYGRKNDISLFVQISTDEVYGEAPERYSFKETDVLNPSSPYASSKAASDLLINSYAKTYGMNVLVTRCTNNYGPYQFPEKLIPKTIVRAIRGLPVILYGSGNQIRDWIFVTDHVKAVTKIIYKGKRGDTYNISSDNQLSNLQVVQMISELIRSLTGKETRINTSADRPGHDTRYSLDSHKLRAHLGWQPETSFMQGLKQTVTWYIENEQWWNPLVTPSLLNDEPWNIRW